MECQCHQHRTVGSVINIAPPPIFLIAFSDLHLALSTPQSLMLNATPCRPGSHKSCFDRTDTLAAHGVYGGRQEERGSVVPRDTPGATECPDGCVNVAPVRENGPRIILQKGEAG